MGYYVHFSVTYSSHMDAEDFNNLHQLAEKTEKQLNELNALKECSVSQECFEFLNAVLDSKNYNTGRKGTLFTWGIVGNYTPVDEIVENLSTFFDEMLRKEIGVGDFNHIIFFQEREQSEQAECWEIYLEDIDDLENKGKLIINHHKLPFCWNQF